MVYTRIGNVVMIKRGSKKIPWPTSVDTILLQIGACAGPFRLPKYCVIWRQPRARPHLGLPKWASLLQTQTLHKQNGQRYIVDWQYAYYNSRYAQQRNRMRLQFCGNGLLVLFAGVGPIPCILSMNYNFIDAVEWNPHAVALGQQNLKLNAIKNVTYHEMDVKRFLNAKSAGQYDDCITFSPTCNDSILDKVFSIANRLIHYRLVSRVDIQNLSNFYSQYGNVTHRVVKNYCKTQCVCQFIIKK